MGFEITDGKYLSVKVKDAQRSVRLRNVPDGYTKEDIISRIGGGGTFGEQVPRKSEKATKKDASLNLLLDIESVLKKKKGVGYENWAKSYNFKTAVMTLNYIADHNLSYSQLCDMANEMSRHLTELKNQIGRKESLLKENSRTQRMIVSYAKTRDVYSDYKKSGYSKKFYNKHREEIEEHKKAKKYYDDWPVSQRKSKAELRRQYSQVLDEKRHLDQEYKKVSRDFRDVLTVKKNVDLLLQKNVDSSFSNISFSHSQSRE